MPQMLCYAAGAEILLVGKVGVGARSRHRFLEYIIHQSLSIITILQLVVLVG